MNKVFRSLILAVAMCVPISMPVGAVVGLGIGCSSTQQRQTVNTLFTVGQGVDAAYKSYLDLVVAGKIPTNDVPAISQRYQQFQQVFSAAIAASALSTNAPPSPLVAAQAAQVTQAIDIAKQRK
jgi:hypothetical protein